MDVPKTIPENMKCKLSENRWGISFEDPHIPENGVRVSLGMKDSPNIYQQKPYAKQIVNGKALDINGNYVCPQSAEAHIPINEFKYRDPKFFKKKNLIQ